MTDQHTHIPEWPEYEQTEWIRTLGSSGINADGTTYSTYSTSPCYLSRLLTIKNGQHYTAAITVSEEDVRRNSEPGALSYLLTVQLEVALASLRDLIESGDRAPEA